MFSNPCAIKMASSMREFGLSCFLPSHSIWLSAMTNYKC